MRGPAHIGIDARIMRLASRQNGIACWDQLIAAGLSADQIQRRIDSGILTPIHRGVYLVGAVVPPLGLDQAALYSCDPGAVLSHFTAAKIWRLRAYPENAHPWVTIPRVRSIRRSGILLHRADVEDRDVRRKGSLRLTSPARAILECTPIIDDAYELEAMVAEANFRGIASDGELRDQCDRNPGRRGIVRLRTVLGIDGGPMRTRSTGERVLLKALREHGVGGFETNARVGGYEVDILWRDLRFCVELDGWDGHKGRVAFERDRLKWARLQAAGIQVMPVTGRQIKAGLSGVMERIQSVLSDRSSDRL